MTTEITLVGGIGRALRRRCPRCGGGGLFRRWFQMEETCPTCGLRFERTEGYWTGSMALNLVVTEVVFVAVLVLTIVATSPDPDWGLVLALSLASNLLVPVGTPVSAGELRKTLKPSKLTIKSMPARFKKVGDLSTKARRTRDDH